MTLAGFWRIARRRWVFLLVGILIGGIIAGSYALTAKPTYESSARLFISSGQNASITDLSQGNAYAQTLVSSYADVATTPIVLESVRRQLGITGSAQKIASRISVTAPVNTVILQITASDGSASGAARLAQAVAERLARVVQSQLTPQIDSGGSAVRLTIVQPASAPDSPAGPSGGLILLIGSMAGLIIALFGVFLEDRLNTRVRTTEELARITSAPVVARVPRDDQFRHSALISDRTAGAFVAESFRSMQAQLRFIVTTGQSKSFVVTSTLDGEGKTTLVSNLAVAAADAGQRTIVIDADLRRSQLANYMGVDGSVGLTDIIVGNATLSEAVQQWGADGLQVLPSGSLPPNPTQILQTPQFAHLIASLRSEFDLIIVDAPPLLAVADAAIVGRNVDGALLVSASGRAHRGQLAVAVATLRQLSVEILAAAQTKVPVSRFDGDSYYASYYGTREE